VLFLVFCIFYCASAANCSFFLVFAIYAMLCFVHCRYTPITVYPVLSEIKAFESNIYGYSYLLKSSIGTVEVVKIER